MPILFDCSCGQTLRAPDGTAGRSLECPICGADLEVPDPSAVDLGLEIETDHTLASRTRPARRGGGLRGFLARIGLARRRPTVRRQPPATIHLGGGGGYSVKVGSGAELLRPSPSRSSPVEAQMG